MRLGKPLEHLQAALRAAQQISNPAEQITTIGRQLGYAGYLIYDAVVWVSLKSSNYIYNCINFTYELRPIPFAS